MIDLRLTTYGVGENARVLHMGSRRIYFSYSTPVAFTTRQGGLVVRQNQWGPTTGKHLNAIDGGNHKGRLDPETFARQFQEEFDRQPEEASV